MQARCVSVDFLFTDTLKNYFKKYGVVEKTRVVIVSVDIFNNITRIKIRTWRPEDLKVMDLW